MASAVIVCSETWLGVRLDRFHVAVFELQGFAGAMEELGCERGEARMRRSAPASIFDVIVYAERFLKDDAARLVRAAIFGRTSQPVIVVPSETFS